MTDEMFDELRRIFQKAGLEYYNKGYNQAIEDALLVADPYFDIPNAARRLVIGGIEALRKKVK